MILLHLFIYILAFICIWFGAGLVVFSTSKFSQRLHISPFAFSFIFLGLLTSTPEFSVGLQAVARNDPQIFAGNLLGGVVMLLLFVIPLLAILGNGISLKHELDHRTLILTLLTIVAPAFFILDQKVTVVEGMILILLYFFLIFLVERKNGIFAKNNQQLLNHKAYSYRDVLKILSGMAIVFVASHVIVEKTLYFARAFEISVFYISLLVIAFGTNLPELSLAIRSVMMGKKEIAMGDYLGSMVVNTFFFGIFTFLQNGEVLNVGNFWVTFIFMTLAAGLFYFYSRSKNFLSRKNGFVMIGLYLLFILFELLRY